MAEFEVERVGGELRRFGVSGSPAPFEVVSPFEPSGDQPQAIASLVQGVRDGDRYQVLLGVTGSGKTFTMAKTIEALGKPTLVMAPNKTLAAQLASELKEFFPNNAVVYFVSYYDYYQPEAYVPSSDTYIEKDSSINEEVEMLRHQATASLLSRRDVIVVASVSCIYGIGSPEDYAGLAPNVDKKEPLERDEFIHSLIDIQYDRNDYDLARGTFRVRGDVVDVYPPYAEHPLRFEFFGDEVELIAEIDEVTGEIMREFDAIPVWPASHYVTEKPKVTAALKSIEEELEARVAELKANDKLLEAQRLEQRTSYDLEMLETMGFTTGIENYSRHLDGRKPGEPPFTLIDYFPKDMLCIIDESHVTVPQIRGMHEGDRSRKITLAAARIRQGKQDKLYLGNLSSLRDWGYAKDYVECMWLILQNDKPDDFVIATGVQHSVREFCQLAFHYVGIELEFVGEGMNEKGVDKATGKVLIEVSPDFYRPTDVVNLWGDPTKARQELGWNPTKTSFEELVKIMVEHDMEKVAVERAEENIRCNLEEYLEKGVVK